MKNQFDVVVIGAGPAGYVAAIRCTQLGLKTACVDQWANTTGKASLGGTCLNVGCIPSKALLESSELFNQVQHEFEHHGINVNVAELDLAQMMRRKAKIVKELTQGIAGLFSANKVKLFFGQGRLHRPGQVSITKPNSNEVHMLHAKNIILATGSRPVDISSAPVNGKTIVNSTGALEFIQVPKKLGIIGAGVIGLELGTVWHRLGSQVTLFEALPLFLPNADTEIAAEALKLYQRQGLSFRFNSRVISCDVREDKVIVKCEEHGQVKTQELDCLVVAVGRKPNSEHLVSDQVQLKIESNGCVQVDESCRTNLKHVFAIGDLVRGPMLAHKGSEEGMMVAELIAGHDAKVSYQNIPSVIYTHPEIAWVGETEQSLKKVGHEYRAGVFPFAASGRARASGDTTGLVKVLADAKTDRILGVHMIGPHCSELIMQAVIATEFSASAEDLALTMFAHPTLSEAFHEAALAVDNRAIHIAKKAKRA